MKKTVNLISLVLSLPIYSNVIAETGKYNVETNTLTIPSVELSNTKYKNVTFSCDPAQGLTCKLTGAISQSCSSGRYSENSGFSKNNFYSIHSMSSEGIEYGGIIANNKEGLSKLNIFTASWMKTPNLDDNPYLKGIDKTNLEPNKAYGIVGSAYYEAYPKFALGKIIVVNNSSDGYTIKQIEDGATAVFTPTGLINSSDSCTTTSGHNFIGNYAFTETPNSRYDINIINGSSGSISLNQNSEKKDLQKFSAQWDSNNEDKYYRGSIGNTYYEAYQRIGAGDQAFVFDIGNGIAITSVDSQGKAKATAVFIKDDQ
ncbi:MAG: hypothetical protein KAH20_06330 [Methylococcales bacterium]|nr:hypothetical protein [Methylococcales bacterium]